MSAVPVTTYSDSPKVYIASLADYNAGRLYGKWFDLADYSSEDELAEAVSKLLENSPARKSGESAEEWAIHDYEYLPKRFGEYHSFEELVAWGNAYNDLEDNEDWEVFLAWLENVGKDDVEGAIEGFRDAYCGEYDDEEDFAYEEVESCGYLRDVPETVARYFDYEAFARDLFLDGYYGLRVNGDFHVFRDI